MNAIVEQQPVSASTLEHVLGTGDLSKLSTQQRVEFYKAVCQSLGLNPLTRPIRFLSFQGQVQAYFTRDGTDQLRKRDNISLHVVDQQIDAGIYTVRVQAKLPSGRTDEDIGAVPLPTNGESRANALMKATTKAKRRVTLSLCGLGWTSEDELDTMPGAVTFDAEAEVPSPAPDARDAINAAVPIRAAAAATPRPPRRSEAPPAERTDEQWRVWLDKLRAACAVLRRRQEAVEIGERESVADAIANGPPWVQRETSAILAETYKRLPEDEAEPAVDDDPFAPTDEIEIVGAEKLAAG